MRSEHMEKYNYKIKDSQGGREEQQDFAGAAATKFGLLVVVCDGMGGTKGGGTASKMAVNIIIKNITAKNYHSPASALLDSIKLANTEIFNLSRKDENYKGMGTTVVAILLQDQKATIAHVGDSRVYQLRSPDLFGKNIIKVFRTNDHSRVFELVKRGILEEEQARTSDDSNVILRALGLNPQVDVEINDNISYLKGDRFLLCTDGVWGAVPENNLLELLNQKADVQTTVTKLISVIDETGYKTGGGHDNLTAALIECIASSLLKPKIKMNVKILIASLAVLLVLSLVYIGYAEINRLPSIQKELEDLKSKNGQLQKRNDSLSAMNKSLSDIISREKQKADNTDKSSHSAGNKHNEESALEGGKLILPSDGRNVSGSPKTDTGKLIQKNGKQKEVKKSL